MYKAATFLVRHFWGKFAEIADGLGVLLLTWNNAHYRYGSFDFQLLEKTLADNQQLLASFRNRHIFSYAPADDPSITRFSASFWRRCGSARARKKECASPVAVAKALHLLAPGYFPLWDLEIANAYGCGYSQQPTVRVLPSEDEAARRTLDPTRSDTGRLSQNSAQGAGRVQLCQIHEAVDVGLPILFRVSTRVNRPANDDEECAREVPIASTAQALF
jgi:hypothetical protein